MHRYFAAVSIFANKLARHRLLADSSYWLYVAARDFFKSLGWFNPRAEEFRSKFERILSKFC